MRYRPSLPTIVLLWLALCVACWVGMFTVSFRWAWDGCPNDLAFGPDRQCADPRNTLISAATLLVFLIGTGGLAWWYHRGRRANAENDAEHQQPR